MIEVARAVGLVALFLGGLFVWLYTIYRASKDPALHEQAQKLAFWAMILAPVLVLAYWLPRAAGRGPFFLADDQHRSQEE